MAITPPATTAGKISETGTEIADAHIGNLIKTEDGELVPIDLQVLAEGAAFVSSPLPDPPVHDPIPARNPRRDLHAQRRLRRDERRTRRGRPAHLRQSRATPPPAPSNNSTRKSSPKRPLAFLAHGLGAYDGPPLATEHEFHALFDALAHPAQPTAPHRPQPRRSARRRSPRINRHRHDLDYGTDGAVVKVLDRAEREQLGFTSRAPRWAAAYKFLPEQQETIAQRHHHPGRPHRRSNTRGRARPRSSSPAPPCPAPRCTTRTRSTASRSTSAPRCWSKKPAKSSPPSSR